MREGSVLGGRYRLDELLGRGGMADVYLAFDLHRQAYVAVKVLREDLAEDPDFVRRFEHEAQALARLDHPNIVRFYSFEHDGASAFIIMDYVAGATLQRRLRELNGQPLPFDEITRILRDVGSALHYAHREGYIHRDVKAGNIMLREDGKTLLSDFGIARAADSMTMTMGPVGTAPYMSPEQILGQKVDARSDIYSLGVVLFEMATGRRPFSGEEGAGTSRMERLQDAQLHVEPPNPRTLNPLLPEPAAAVILRALAKSPDRRFQDVTSLVQAWEDALGLTHEQPAAGKLIGAAVVARPKTERPASVPASSPAAASQPPVAAGGRTRRGLWVAVSAVVLLCAAAVAVLLMLQPGAGAQPTQVAELASPVPALTATPTPLPPTPDLQGTAQVLAGRIATQTVEAQATQNVLVSRSAASTVEAIAGTATTAAQSTVTAVAAATATAASEQQGTATAVAAAMQAAAARSATSTAEAQATAAAAATATRAAQAAAEAQASAAAAARAATAEALSRQRPGLVFDFERDLTWKRGDQPYGQLIRSAEQVKAGSAAGRLQYDFPAVPNNYVVFMATPPLTIPGQATGITAWVYGNGSGHFLNAWVQDADGEVRSYTFGQVQHRGWQQMIAWFDEKRSWPNGHISGPDDSKLRYPASLYALVLDGVPDGQASTGVIFLDEMFSTQDAIPTANPTAQPRPYAPPVAGAAPPAAGASGLRFQLSGQGQCIPNAGNSYFNGFVRHRNNAPINGICVHTAYYGPRVTKCTGCDGIGDGQWGFSPFGGPAPAGTTVEVFVVACPASVPGGGVTVDTPGGFGDLTPLSDKWTHTFRQSEQCTGITFVGD